MKLAEPRSTYDHRNVGGRTTSVGGPIDWHKTSQEVSHVNQWKVKKEILPKVAKTSKPKQRIVVYITHHATFTLPEMILSLRTGRTGSRRRWKEGNSNFGWAGSRWLMDWSPALLIKMMIMRMMLMVTSVPASPAPSQRASSPPPCAAAPSPRTSSSARAPAASSSRARDAVAVGGRARTHTHTQTICQGKCWTRTQDVSEGIFISFIGLS